MRAAIGLAACLVLMPMLACKLPSLPPERPPMVWSRYSPGDGMIIAGTVTSSIPLEQPTFVGFFEERYGFEMRLEYEVGYAYVPPGRYRLVRIYLGTECWTLDAPAFDVKTRHRVVLPTIEVRGPGHHGPTVRGVGTGTSALSAFETRFSDSPWTSTETVAVDIGTPSLRPCPLEGGSYSRPFPWSPMRFRVPRAR